MLSVEPVRSTTKSDREDDGGSSFLIGVDDDFAGGSCLLDDINFDDFFIGIEDGDLPDLEMDPEILAEFSSVEESTSCSPDHLLNSSPGSASGESCLEEEEKEKVDDNVVQESSAVTAAVSASSGRKPASSTSTKVPQGKRKVKVDWTPELHRRFVQAVEQLGVDKAVPSRILELMGIDCLTRHNIASHLQKYRSHRKHLLAREAEAANWSQRRQLYGGGRGGGGCGGVAKREMAAPWVVPTIGFPPPGAVPAPFRPLHVWGHPHPHPGAVDQPPPMVQVWPKHLVRSPSPSPPPQPWVPPAAAPPNRPPYWKPWFPHPHLGGSHMTQGTPYYPQPLPPSHRFPAPVPVPGIPQAMFKADANVNTLLSPGMPNTHLHIMDFHPSKESVDAALEDVLAQPWLPLPLGLKPPSTESVLLELQRQGISKIPPSCA